MQRLFLLFSACVLISLTACRPGPDGVDDDGPVAPSFDRAAMLENWAEDVIVPAYAASSETTAQLAATATVFAETPTAEFLGALRTDFQAAYLSWQSLSPFLIGRAEEINLRFRANTYPTNPEMIEENIAAAAYNLALPSQTVAQGFPALDYLLYADPDALLATGSAADSRRDYLAQLALALSELVSAAAAEWTPEFIRTYTLNDGNSATSSVDRTVNDYIFYFEKFLRAGKVGIPAGVFSDTPLANRAEALHSKQSKKLFLAALTASENFFNNDGLAEYLDALNVQRDGEALSRKITNQFSAIRAAAENVNNDFSAQVTTDNVKMLALYDEMQRLVVLLKVDMLQALSINVDYVDADGD